jgi:GT2 family glycosyltransferase
MEKTSPKIAVLILGYNDEHNLKESIGTALDQSYENYEIIYIDNASKDASLKIVEKEFPSIRKILHEKNLGYAGAYALALENIFRENFDAAVLLNSDVIVEKDWLKELVLSAFADEKIAIAQPKIFLSGENAKLANTFGNKINYLGFGFCGHYMQPDNTDFEKDMEIASASGASLLIKKEAYEKIGNIDKNFFAYLEDQDLSWRAIMQGYKIVLSAKSIMYHKYSYKKNQRNHWKFFTLERNRLYFLFKNYPAKTLFLIAPMFFAMELGVFADSLTKGYFLDKIRAYGSFLSNFKQIWLDRQKALQGLKLTNGELFAKLNPTIEFEEIDSLALKIANKMLSTYYKIIKALI